MKIKETGLTDIITRDKDYQSCKTCRTKKQHPDGSVDPYAHRAKTRSDFRIRSP